MTTPNPNAPRNQAGLGDIVSRRSSLTNRTFYGIVEALPTGNSSHATVLFAGLGSLRENLKDLRVAGVMIQRLKKDGTWGKPTLAKAFGAETVAEILDRYRSLNPAMTFRLADRDLFGRPLPIRSAEAE